MTREELIEEAAKAAGEAAWGVYWLAIPAAFRERFVHDAEIAWAVFEKAQAPTDDEREVLTQAALDSERLRQIAEWLSMELGHEETAKRVNLIADRHDALALRRPAQTDPTDEEREDMIAWLMRDHGDDLSPLGRDYTDAEIADMLRRPAQGEPTDIQFAARRSGKSQALIDSILAQANERGIRVEVVYPQAEPKYEYQWGHQSSDFNSDFFGYDPYPTYEEALADMREDGDPLYVVVRRVKAGAWEPVPNQEGEQP